MKNFFLAISLTIFAILFSSTSSFAIISITFENASIKQGDNNCIVQINDHYCGTSSATFNMTCLSGGSQKCYTNEEIKTLCPMALPVVWLGGGLLDTECDNIQTQFANGVTTGTYNMVYQNVESSETVTINYHWFTNSEGFLTIEIDVV